MSGREAASGRPPLEGYIACLPQKPPFLFVDELERVTPGENAAGAVAFPEGHPIFQNHLPGNPLVPGVILIEALAQLAGIVLVPPGGVEPISGYLGEVKRMRFRRKVLPGERVALEARLLQRFAGAARFAVVARVGDEVAAEGELVLAGGRKQAPRVLFVCIENAGRSQMAEAFARALGLDAQSCGSRPAEKVNPIAVEAMREKGLDISGKIPKGFEAVPRAEVVVTMGCGDACPYVPGRHQDWNLPDPKGKGIDEVRPIRDEIERRVRDLAAEVKG